MMAVTVFTACQPAAPSGPAEVTITGWFYPRFVPPGKDPGVFEQELIDEFLAIPGNEHITINFEMLQWDTGPEQVNVAIATGDAPDFVFDFTGRIMGYGAAGALVPLNDFVPAALKTDIPEAIWSQVRDGNDNIWMFPTTVAIVGMGVNRQIFRQAGIENLLPTNATRTWSNAEFEEVCQRILDANIPDLLAPFSLHFLNEQGDASIRMMIQNQGADFINPAYSEIVLNSPEGIAGLQWLYSMYEKGFIVSHPETNNSLGTLEMFMQSKTAISVLFSSGNVGVLNNLIEQGDADPDFDLMFVTNPTPTGTNPKVESQVVGFCIFDQKDDARHKATFDFINFMASKPEAVLATNQFPARSSMDLAALDARYASEEFKYLSSLTPHLGDAGLGMKNYAGVRAVFFPEMQAIFTGIKSVEQGLNDFVAAANRAIQ